MKRLTAKTTIPVLLCAIATISLGAAGILLFDFRDDLDAPAEADTSDEDRFTAYTAPSEESPPSDPSSEYAEIQWEDLDITDDWEILEPTGEPSEDTFEEPQDNADVDRPDDAIAEQPQQYRDSAETSPGGADGYQPTGTVVVVTDFSQADVDINGEDYPAYSDDLQNRGMELPAHEPHLITVEIGDNERVYEIELRPGEERLLMVELSGMSREEEPQRRARAAPAERRERSQDDSDDDDDDDGRITVYSRPRGDIYVGSRDMEERTPGTVNVDPGRHEVQVEYEDGEMSETKTVRVRGGSRTKLFFRADEE